MMWEAVCLHVEDVPTGSPFSIFVGPSGFLPTFCCLREWWSEMTLSR